MRLNVKFNVINEVFKVDFESTTIGPVVPVDPYEGPYVVIPKLDEQIVLLTKDKSMSDNVTVREIPWEEVSNPQGGITVTIGGY